MDKTRSINSKLVIALPFTPVVDITDLPMYNLVIQIILDTIASRFHPFKYKVKCCLDSSFLNHS